MMRKTTLLLLQLLLYACCITSPLQAAFPDDPLTDIEWSCGTSTVADVACAFNQAHHHENAELDIALPDIELPGQSTWNTMSDSEKTLWLVNVERRDRNLLPLHGVESHVVGVAQAYADYLLANNAWGHYEDGRSPWERLNSDPVINACHDFLGVAENLAVFVSSAAIPMPIERSVYVWMYDDSGSSWGHRHAILWYPYNDNSGQAGKEGFLGLGRASGGPYQGPFSSPYPNAEMIVMNVFDPCSSWDYGKHALIDFNGDTTHDIALFHPAEHKWFIREQTTSTYGTTECIPVPGNYDGDGDTDLAVVDLTRGDGMAKWYLDGSGVFIYGLKTWIPVPGDYDGDGDTDAALFNPDTGKWYVRNQFVTTYGTGGIPVPGDYDGDGTTDIAVFNPTDHKWYIKDIGIFTYGMADCIPVPGDYDGDGDTDLAVIDTSRPDGMAKWYIRNQAVFIYGAVADTIPVPGDYDGDGDTDPCLFYQNTGKWYCRQVGVWTYGSDSMIPLASNLATRYAISQAAGGGTVW
jgi:hypothetical protein